MRDQRSDAHLQPDGEPPELDRYDEPTMAEMAALAQSGGAFDWLADEPDLYSLDDGEPLGLPDDR